jgi:hypothetical protein
MHWICAMQKLEMKMGADENWRTEPKPGYNPVILSPQMGAFATLARHVQFKR